MKFGIYSILFFFLGLATLNTSCSKDTDEILVDTSLPVGDFTVDLSGNLVAQNGTPTSGVVEIGEDSDGVTFFRFGSDFMTQLATGTVGVYLSTSPTFMADPGMGNPDLLLIGSVKKNGEDFIKIEGGVPNKFTHVILWCNTAGIPFGNASFN